MWRRTKPGMVRIRPRDYIQLLERARRATDLEAEEAVLLAEQARHSREARARELVAELAADAGVRFSDLDVDGLVVDLPQTADGRLHEPAFAALLDQHVWRRRLVDAIR